MNHIRRQVEKRDSSHSRIASQNAVDNAIGPLEHNTIHPILKLQRVMGNQRVANLLRNPKAISAHRKQNVIQLQPSNSKPDIKAIINDPIPTLFPVFADEFEHQAFQQITATLGMDPRSLKMTNALLSTVKVPEKPAELKSAYESVLRQLRTELHYKENVKAYFKGLRDFTQEIHSSFNTRQQWVLRYLGLKDDDVGNIFMGRLISEGLEAVGEVKHPLAYIVSESLKVCWDTHNKLKAAVSANKVSVAVIKELQKLDQAFNDAITEIEEMKLTVLQDWSKLQKIGALTWPAKTKAMRAHAGRGYEIEIWKSLLPTSCKILYTRNMFLDDRKKNWDTYYKNQPHSFVTYVWEHEKKLLSDTKGWRRFSYYLVNSSGKPIKLAITKRLFTELQIPRNVVFENWSIPKTRVGTNWSTYRRMTYGN